MPPELVSRFDVAEIGKPTRTPQGFLRVPAFLTRAGVFTYRRADGTTIREFRPAEEVFAPESLATLAAAPVTDLHPSEMVTPANVRKHSVGHVSERVRADGELVAAEITIQDANVIALVEQGKRREVSCGYQCRIDATPGTHRGEAYDVVQRAIVYNHAALGPRNWGRAGRDVALRVDSAEQPDEVFVLDAQDAVGIAVIQATRVDAQARVPAGSPNGGQFAGSGSSGGGAASSVAKAATRAQVERVSAAADAAGREAEANPRSQMVVQHAMLLHGSAESIARRAVRDGIAELAPKAEHHRKQEKKWAKQLDSIRATAAGPRRNATAPLVPDIVGYLSKGRRF